MRDYTRQRPQAVAERMLLPPKIPVLPDDILNRFSKTAPQYNEDMEAFWGKVKAILVDSHQEATQAVNQATTTVKKTEASFSTGSALLLARIISEETVRASADGALASTITGVIAAYISADTVLTAAVTAESTARVSADGALATSISTVSATVGALSASVTAEASARATADGYLSSKYTLLVTAGDLVTGINITSDSGPGTNLSTITFQTDRLRVQTSSGAPVVLLDLRATGFVFGTDLASDNYVAGSAGWQLTRAGNLELNSGTFRGVVDVVGVGTHIVLDGTHIDFGGGYLTIFGYNAAAVMNLGVGGNAIIFGAAGGAGSIGFQSGRFLNQYGDGSLGAIGFASIGVTGDMRIVGNIQQGATDGWTPALYTGDISTAGDSIQFQSIAGQLYYRVNGGAGVAVPP